jgi:hypothetical protein
MPSEKGVGRVGSGCLRNCLKPSAPGGSYLGRLMRGWLHRESQSAPAATTYPPTGVFEVVARPAQAASRCSAAGSRTMS